jgi:shikimate kinase
MNDDTRRLIKAKTVSVWLKADLDVLARRLARKDNRPLLQGPEPPIAVLTRLAAERDPVYAQADITVETGEAAHQVTVELILKALTDHLESRPQ